MAVTGASGFVGRWLLARFTEVKRIHTGYLPHALVHMRLGGVTNRSWRIVWKQNQEIRRLAEAHGLQPSLGGFVLGKLWSLGPAVCGACCVKSPCTRSVARR